MRVAVVGKGGAGKSVIAGTMAALLVIAVLAVVIASTSSRAT